METKSLSTAPQTRGTLPRVALCYSGCHTRGGVERVMVEAARHLSSRCHVSVFAQHFSADGTLPPAIAREKLGGIDYPLGFGLPATKRRTERRLRNQHWDAVGGFGVQAPEGSVVWFQSVHAAWWEHCQLKRRGFHRRLQHLNPFHRVVLKMERELLEQRKYRRLIALTAQVKSDLMRLYGVNAADIDLLPNGFRKEEFSPDLQKRYRETLRAGLRIPEKAWVILFVANEWERKGLLPLIEAVGRLRDPGVHLVAVGRLPEAYVRGWAARCGVGPQVHVPGSTGSVNRWFGMADVFALPTTYEAWGMVIIEALASGLPVLTSRHAGAAVAIEEGKNGCLLEDPTDSSEIYKGLLRMRAGDSLCATYISETAHDYQWSTILGRYECVLMNAFGSAL